MVLYSPKVAITCSASILWCKTADSFANKPYQCIPASMGMFCLVSSKVITWVGWLILLSKIINANLAQQISMDSKYVLFSLALVDVEQLAFFIIFY